MLRGGRKHGEHPMMARQIAEHPGHRSVGPGEHVGHVHQRHIIQLRAADPARLQATEQPGLVQIRHALRWRLAACLRLRRTDAQGGQQNLRARQHVPIGIGGWLQRISNLRHVAPSRDIMIYRTIIYMTDARGRKPPRLIFLQRSCFRTPPCPPLAGRP
jgi:hypothetical protein